MIAIARKQETSPIAGWQEGFLKLLPAIERYARLAFRGLPGEAQDDAICEVIANCFCAYRRLYERNELQRAFATPLVRFAVAAYHRGRRVGTPQASRDLFSVEKQRPAEVEAYSPGTLRDERAEWAECLTDNRRTPVPEQVHFRIEFPRWLNTQTRRNRQIARRLLLGYSTEEVARQFKVSSGRISQIRRKFYDSWNEFSNDRPLLAKENPSATKRPSVVTSFQRMIHS